MLRRNMPVLLAAVLALAAGGTAAQSVAPTFVTDSDASFSRPHDLVLSPDGRFLYVADVGNHVVKVVDPVSLETVGRIGDGALSSPHDVAFDEAGRLLVADTGNDRVAIFEVDGTTGQLVTSLRDSLHSPEGVAPAVGGRIYVTNARTHEVLLFENGKLVRKVGANGDGDNEYVRPHDVDLDDRVASTLPIPATTGSRS